jgi:hypothetical protein
MVTLIVRNSQGASDETKHADRFAAGEAIAATWHDPENLTAQVIDSAGETVFQGPATDLIAMRPAAGLGYSDAEYSEALATPIE